MNPLTLTEFRAAFPSFTEALYPDAAVEIRLALANDFFRTPRWGDGDLRKHVMGLYTAHYLSAFGSQSQGGNGQGSSAMGVVSSKSVDGASVSYDTTSTAWSGAGFWNSTPYGRELWYLMHTFGAGAIQL